MSYSKDEIRDAIRSFIMDEPIGTENDRSIKGSLRFSNLQFIQNSVNELTKKVTGLDSVDFSITSESIQTSLHDYGGRVHFRAVDYQWLFLHHTILSYEKRYNLLATINSFVERYKSQFRIGDIAVSKTGATRCKTNLRFALDQLRKLGLVVNRDEQNKRSARPSIMGLLIMLCALKDEACQEKFAKLKYSSVQGGIASLYPSSFYYTESYDAQLLGMISAYRKPGAFYGVLATLVDNGVLNAHRAEIENLQMEYAETVIAGLEIQGKGVKQTKEFARLSNQFHSYLALQKEAHLPLFTMLHTTYKNSFSN